MLLATAAALAAPRQQHASPLSPGAAQHALEKVYIPPWFDRMLLEKFNATGALPARLLSAGFPLDTPENHERKCGELDACPHGMNGLITYDFEHGQAGLSDRRFMLWSLTNLAYSLCANLAVHEPAQMLSVERHNHGIPLSTEWWWDRYFKLPNSLQWINLDAPSTQLPEPTIGPSLGTSQVQQEWQAAKQAAASGQPWRWSINNNPFFWLPADSQALNGIHGCGKTTIRTSDGVLSAAERTRRALGVTDGGASLATLHLRRGDAMGACDTSVDAVVRYMKCSWGDVAAWDQPGTESLVIFTDETNPTYIAQVVSELSRMPRWGGGVTHGDPVVLAQLSPADQTDNYLVYAVAVEVMGSASHTYALDRQWPGQAACGSCVSRCLAGWSRSCDDKQTDHVDGPCEEFCVDDPAEWEDKCYWESCNGCDEHCVDDASYEKRRANADASADAAQAPAAAAQAAAAAAQAAAAAAPERAKGKAAAKGAAAAKHCRAGFGLFDCGPGYHCSDGKCVDTATAAPKPAATPAAGEALFAKVQF